MHTCSIRSENVLTMSATRSSIDLMTMSSVMSITEQMQHTNQPWPNDCECNAFATSL